MSPSGLLKGTEGAEGVARRSQSTSGPMLENVGRSEFVAGTGRPGRTSVGVRNIPLVALMFLVFGCQGSDVPAELLTAGGMYDVDAAEIVKHDRVPQNLSTWTVADDRWSGGVRRPRGQVAVGVQDRAEIVIYDMNGRPVRVIRLPSRGRETGRSRRRGGRRPQ